MLADYFNNPLMPMSHFGMSEKWYVVARTRERKLFKKIDVFMYLSMTHDNMFDLLYVSFDEINRRMTRCYHGKFVIKLKNNYLIIRQGLWRKKFFIIANNEDLTLAALTNRRKSKVWILSKGLPFKRIDFENIIQKIEKQGFDVENIELFYDLKFNI